MRAGSDLNCTNSRSKRALSRAVLNLLAQVFNVFPGPVSRTAACCGDGQNNSDQREHKTLSDFFHTSVLFWFVFRFVRFQEFKSSGHESQIVLRSATVTAGQQGHEKQNQKNNEQNFGDVGCDSGDSEEAKQESHNGNQEERYCPAQHKYLLLYLYFYRRTVRIIRQLRTA